ncbi:hypothetical protein MKK75_07285 [Methylobacterium sp. J-030]|uniref:hypothetical protein n=1 Tax=Methylobacterium sp. J-030 TaxID=2836627 RepID=UPI001FBBE3CF|nr:hypothetical protein [Methylobacterium sp. J-030]MCJ2068606.1 hypothetical protein [Methylobacterium sp. J-030]
MALYGGWRLPTASFRSQGGGRRAGPSPPKAPPEILLAFKPGDAGRYAKQA